MVTRSKIPHIIALIPAYNEGARIGPVVTGAAAHLPVVVVDDGSTDDTAVQAEKAGATVLRQIPNQGKGAALQKGFRWALESGVEAVVTLDADGQHDPAEIRKFLLMYRTRRPTLIIGARNFKQMPLIRRFANWSGGKIFSWALGQTVQDNQSGYRLLARPLLEEMLGSRETGFEFEVEMIVICVQRGWEIAWVPIRTIYAGESSHINNREHFFNFWRLVADTRRRMREVGDKAQIEGD